MIRHIYSERRDGKVQQERVCFLGRVEELNKRGAIDRMIANLVEVARQRGVRAEPASIGRVWSAILDVTGNTCSGQSQAFLLRR